MDRGQQLLIVVFPQRILPGLRQQRLQFLHRNIQPGDALRRLHAIPPWSNSRNCGVRGNPSTSLIGRFGLYV